MAWLLRIGAGLLVIVWAIALKQAQGFTRFWPSVIGVTAAVASLLILTAAMKDLPVGTAYAVWVGIGALGVAFTGIWLFGENASPARLSFLLLILVGIVGLRMVEGPTGS